VAEQGFVFLSEGARALRAGGRGGTLIHVTGGSARRAMAGRGLWSAGAQAVRALVHAAAQELREEGIHVALLVVDATIESPKTATRTAGAPRDSLADQEEIARAVAYLAGQTRRAWSHELTVTPSGDRWLP
jgi:NAD(P)-dependent dehydrogenase (short-subunit alcohol dehydrogenase family)